MLCISAVHIMCTCTPISSGTHWRVFHSWNLLGNHDHMQNMDLSNNKLAGTILRLPYDILGVSVSSLCLHFERLILLPTMHNIEKCHVLYFMCVKLQLLRNTIYTGKIDLSNNEIMGKFWTALANLGSLLLPSAHIKHNDIILMYKYQCPICFAIVSPFWGCSWRDKKKTSTTCTYFGYSATTTGRARAQATTVTISLSRAIAITSAKIFLRGTYTG